MVRGSRHANACCRDKRRASERRECESAVSEKTGLHVFSTVEGSIGRCARTHLLRDQRAIGFIAVAIWSAD